MLETSERLLRLLSLLQARPAWPGAELAERLRVTTRTVRRDVGRLRRLGYPVDSLTGTGGGYRLGVGAALPPLLLDDDEAVAVAVGLRAGTGLAGVEEAALSALAKLEQVFPPRLRHRVAAIAAATVTLTTPTPGIDPELLATLAQACRSSLRVRTGYTDAHGRSTERTLEPHRLVHTGRRWYLVARDVHRDAWRTLRVDRLSAPEITGHTFVLRDPPDAAALVSQAIAVSPYRHTARVRVHAGAETLAARVPPTVATIERLDDATSLLTTGAHDPDSIAVHLALLGFDIELRTRMHAIARRLLVGAGRDDRQAPGAPLVRREDTQMSGDGRWAPASRPEDLSQFFVERANAGHVEGLVALYEPDAVLALPTGAVAEGAVAIRQAYQRLLADRPTFTAGDQQPALINGDLALTSTRLPGGGATAEIARRQPDGTWLWTIDQPNILG